MSRIVITGDDTVSDALETSVNANFAELYNQSAAEVYEKKPDYLASDQGKATAAGNTTIKDYVDALGSDNGTIVLTHSVAGATTTYTLDTDETIPSNIKLVIQQGAVIDGSGTLTINGPFEGSDGCFGSSITVTGLSVAEPDWWGEDAAAFNSALSAVTSNGKVEARVGSNYTIADRLLVQKPMTIDLTGATLTLSGTNAGFYLDTTIASDKVSFLNGDIIGDGTSTTNQGFIRTKNVDTPGSITITRLDVSGTRIYNIKNGIRCPGVATLTIDNILEDTTVGELPGMGYGVATGFDTDEITITNSHFRLTTRHAIYIGGAKTFSIIGNTFENHRSSWSDTTSTERAAVIISRSRNGVVTGNAFYNCHDMVILVDDDSTYAQKTANINVTGNTFEKCYGVIFQVGASETLGASVGVSNVSFSNNTIILDSTWDGHDINIGSAADVDVTGNNISIDGTNTASEKTVISLNDSAYGAMENISILNNRATMDNSGTSIFVKPYSSIQTGTQSIDVEGNKVKGFDFYCYVIGATNPNYKNDDDEEEALSGATPSIAGRNRFTMSNSVATDVTALENPYEGKKIQIRFLATPNTTLKATTFYLAGRIDYTPNATDIITMEYLGSKWIEVSRSEN